MCKSRVRWSPWVGFALLGAGACQVVVGETELTDVRCENEGAVGPPACAVGQVCQNGRCVPGASVADGGAGASGAGGTGNVGGAGAGAIGGSGAGPGGRDAGDAAPDSTRPDASEDVIQLDVVHDVTDEQPVEAAPDVAPDAPLKALGEPCNAPAECSSELCFQVPGKTAKYCSKFCCSSLDCTMEQGICVPYGGANACFKASALDLVLGAKSVGETCANPTECAYGRCVGTCIDACCKGDDCALVEYQGTKNWYSGASGSGTTGSMDECAGNQDCLSSNCQNFDNVLLFPETDWEGALQCGGPCCSDGDCPGGQCEYVWQGSSLIRHCTPNAFVRPSDHRPCCGSTAGCNKCEFVTEPAFDSSNYSTLSLNWPDAKAFRCTQ